MARGGKRSGAGRKAGTANRKTREIADQATAEGITPLEVMLDNMRFFHGEAAELRQQIAGELAAETPDAQKLLKLLMGMENARQLAGASAVAAAPYMHARLATMEVTGKDGGALVVEIIRYSDTSPK